MASYASRRTNRRRETNGLLRFAWLLSIAALLFLPLYLLWYEDSILDDLRSLRSTATMDLQQSETPNLARVLENTERGDGEALVQLSPEQEGERVLGGEGQGVDLVISPQDDGDDGYERFLDVGYWRKIISDLREGGFEAIGGIAESISDFGSNLSLRGFLDMFFEPDPLSVNEGEAIIPLQQQGAVGEVTTASPQEDMVLAGDAARSDLFDDDRLQAIGVLPSDSSDVFSRTVAELVETARPAGQGVDVYAGLLHPNPDPKLIELTPDGVLPRIDSGGRAPWQVYKRPHLSGSNLPQIAVIITNLGLSEFDTARSIHFPGEITLAFAPYARRLGDWIENARGEGHEVLLTLPMEPKRYPQSDPGPFGLLTSLDKEENIKRLRYNLSRGTGYVGVINFLGDKFVLDATAVEPIMQSLSNRGLVFVDTHPDRLSLASLSAVVLNMPHLSVDVVIEQNLSLVQVGKRMRDASRLARSRSFSTMVVHPFPHILDELQAWLATLEEVGVELVPVSALVLGYDEDDS